MADSISLGFIFAIDDTNQTVDQQAVGKFSDSSGGTTQVGSVCDEARLAYADPGVVLADAMRHVGGTLVVGQAVVTNVVIQELDAVHKMQQHKDYQLAQHWSDRSERPRRHF